MDPPPLPTVLHYQDSVESSSSPKWDGTLPPPKLRMMCSYGGHIIPRPRDNSLCYMGGETRIVVADRHTSLADLCSRLSTTLLNGRHFTLKYQLPTEDLDSLVSVSTDEDLDNMVEEYDRLNSSNSSSKPSRLRLFLFVSKPETAASMGSLLDDAKSETWFVDALNGAGLLPRGLSDSAPIDNLLEHKDNYMELEIQHRHLNLPDSPLVETTSSFGSTSSSPSMSNLPHIKVKVDHMNQMAGLDEQLSQLNVSVPPQPVPVPVPDSEPTGGMRKPPLPLQPVQRKFGHDAYSLPSPDSKHGLHSPDSIASDSSIAWANCQTKNTFTQDPNAQSNRENPTQPAIHPNATINYQTPIQQIPDSSDTQPPLTQDQQKQQQFYQARPHFIQHQQPQPVSSYYPVYAPPPQIDNQQYPLYFLPVTQNHPYGMPLQSNATDASSAATPPLYPTKTVTKPDTVTNSMYGTATPTMIQVPSNQFQQQYMNMNVSQIPHHPPTPLPISNGGKYGYEYAHPTQDPVYYSQHQSVPPSQYQTMTPASAMLLAQVPLAPESAKQ
ncbi:hypothetical protein L1987_37827 [Smallanthus sonchifolius]|uniref:Uncharacterized protein n=1 Tax=Smallanthus sonchifolius TaxID=185202 RepID=A0ACB9HIC3_9ASTR|nr:hypothetical protein L1987_37827 [Smallanthus sonchifolius]